MAKQTINLGATPDGAGGDTARTAFEKTQANVDELYGLAVIERGSNSNGSYVRFADGTQLCMAKVTWPQHSGGGAQSSASIQNAASFVGQVYSFLSQDSAWGQNVSHWMEGQSSNGAVVYARNDHTDPLDITLFWFSTGRWY
ncbi:hypothetical protein [Azotobacter beijerinckii]|uniref:hypothetical protein n=1 Tax=Azotobacter beijerinckii TaxID=170623 RepID=UPI002952D170|nr:hypothetical protein [Azotobacter beijerinckii]MDV7209891.1 hypothetical protein [Azotobacter beijerinckii]